jgi:cytochrome bd-type quinol oxidase subunit 1
VKTTERIALIYGLSVLGAGAVSYWRGRRGQELFADAALHGVVAGTTFNVVGWLVTESGVKVPLVAQVNSAEGIGKLTEKGKDLLAQVNVSDFYAAMKENGVKIAPIPDNPSIVTQDAD